MKFETLELLTCPTCRAKLALSGNPSSMIQTGSLQCDRCKENFPVVDGIPHFLRAEELTGLNQKFSRLYDWFSVFYRLFSKPPLPILA